MKKCAKELFDFINTSPTPYHAIDNIKNTLLNAGFVELYEDDKWELSAGGKYFVTRNGTSVIAFKYNGKNNGFAITASHSDFCSLKLKASLESANDVYTTLPVERYGGMINYTWFDRPLSVAGRAQIKDDDGIRSVLVDLGAHSAVIPSVAIHMNRGVNDNFSPNAARDMSALVSTGKVSIKELVCDIIGQPSGNILSLELFLYASEQAVALGKEELLMVAPRIDNLAGSYTTLKAFVDSNNEKCAVYAVFDNEEVGSQTKQGAASDFLGTVLERISGSREDYFRSVANSFMLSVDNAHAEHPNHPELSDKANAPKLSGGVVLKFDANQRYTTDGISAALVTELAARGGVRLQVFHNRSDMPGGSTLGSIATAKVPVLTADIGIPQLAMHSAVETAHSDDLCEMVKLVKTLYECDFEIKPNKIIIK